ncbi:MAG: DinB family protein [Flavobacteriaceae bacterium]
MVVRQLIDQLSHSATVFSSLLKDVGPGLQSYRQERDRWNLLEIICHLCDEEVLDFRARILLALTENGAVPIPIDPEGWPREHNYAEQDFDERLRTFLAEREVSVQTLKGNVEANWNQCIGHPVLGALSARYLLTNWLAHDYHHIRQINTIKYAYLKERTGSDLGYAGKW